MANCQNNIETPRQLKGWTWLDRQHRSCFRWAINVLCKNNKKAWQNTCRHMFIFTKFTKHILMFGILCVCVVVFSFLIHFNWWQNDLMKMSTSFILVWLKSIQSEAAVYTDLKPLKQFVCMSTQLISHHLSSVADGPRSRPPDFGPRAAYASLESSRRTGWRWYVEQPSDWPLF